MSLGMSVSPELSSCRTSELMIRSTRSGSTGRLRKRDVDRAGELVSVERLPLSVLFYYREFAQLHALEGREAGRAIGTEPSAPDRAAIIGRPEILYLRIIGSAKRTAHRLLPVLPAAFARRGPRLHRSGSGRTARGPFRARPLRLRRCRPVFRASPCNTSTMHFPTIRNSSAPKPRVVAAGEPRRMPGGHGRLLRVERNAVLVAGYAGSPEAVSASRAGQPQRAQIDQHQMESVPPETMSSPAPPRLAASALAFSTTA